MSAIIIQADKKNIRLLSELAQNLGGKVSTLDEEQLEDIHFGQMMQNEKTGKTVTRETIMKKLK